MDKEEAKWHKKRWWLPSAIVVACLLAAAASYILLRPEGAPLPPAAMRATFPLYYPAPLPGSFSVERAGLAYDPANSLLAIPLINSYGHRVTITEQPMPAKLKFEMLKGEGDLIDGIEGRAAVSSVEGRIVATMIGKENKTLLLINTANATKEEVIAVVKSLHPVR